MKAPWHWYLVRDQASGEVYVRTYVGRPGEVRGGTWHIPYFGSDGSLVTLVLQPRWQVERNVPGVNAAYGGDCEWVVVRRDMPRPAKCLDLGCGICYPENNPPELCDKCGQEVFGCA